MLPAILTGLALLALAVSAFRDPGLTRRALAAALRSGLALLPSLLALTAAVGLTTALLPPAGIARLFQVHGRVGFFGLAAAGSVLTLPSPVAYPLAGSLHRMGVGLPALAAFITTLTMVGVVTAPLEIRTFGRRFTVVRQALSLGLAMAVGAALGVVL